MNADAGRLLKVMRPAPEKFHAAGQIRGFYRFRRIDKADYPALGWRFSATQIRSHLDSPSEVIAEFTEFGKRKTLGPT